MLTIGVWGYTIVITISLQISQKMKKSIDIVVFTTIFTAENKMKFNSAYFYGYYFYYTSKSRDWYMH